MPTESMLNRSALFYVMLSVAAMGWVSSVHVWADEAINLDQAVGVDGPDEPMTGVQPPAMLRLLRLQPLTGDAKEQAAQPLDQAITTLAVPDYLKRETDDAGAVETTGTGPDGEAVKAYVKARDAYGRGDLAEALKLVEQCIRLDPQIAGAHLLLGRLYTDISDKPKAAAALMEAAKLDPVDPNTLFRLGQLAFENRRWEEAAVLMYRSQHSPRPVDAGLNYMAAYFLGESLLQLGRDAAAVESLTEYLREPVPFTRSTRYIRQARILDQQRDTVHLRLGDASMRLGQFDEAIRHYRQTWASDRINRSLLAPRLVYALISAGQFADSEMIITNLFANPDHAAVAAALAEYQVSAHPENTTLNAAMLKVYEQTDRSEHIALALARVYEGAARRTFLTEHLQHKPDDIAIFKLLLADLAREDVKQAVAMAVRLLPRAPGRSEAITDALMDVGAEPTALLAGIAALPVADRVSAASWFLRGSIELADDQREAANESFTRSLDRDPDFLPAQAAVLRLMIAQGRAGEAIAMVDAYGADAHPQLRMLGVVAKQQVGRHDDAILELDRMLADQPTNIELLLARARSLRAKGDYARAEASLLQALTAEPQREAIYEQLFAIYEREQPDMNKYRQLLGAARRAIPSARITRMKTARLYAALDESLRAEAILRELVAERPTDLDALNELAAVLGRVDRWADMVTLLNDLLDRDATNLAALEALRSVTRQTDQNELFYTRYETYLKARPADMQTHIDLAELYEQWNKVDQALGEYEQVLTETETPQRVALLNLRMAQLLHEHKRYAEAEKRMDQAIESADTEARLNLRMIKAVMTQDADRHADAVKQMGQLIVDYPEHADAIRLQLARMLADMKRLDDALAEVDKVIASQPGAAADLYYMQSTLLHGEPKAAELYEKVLLKALDADPNHAPANNDLGYTWAEQGRNLARAEQMIRKALSVEANSAAYLDSLGWVRYKRGEFADAVTWLNRARQAPGGDDPVIYDHLADALWQAGRTDDAVRIWRTAIQRINAAGDSAREDHIVLLPVLQRKVAAFEQGASPPVAEVPEAPAEDKPPDLPMPQMQ